MHRFSIFFFFFCFHVRNALGVVLLGRSSGLVISVSDFSKCQTSFQKYILEKQLIERFYFSFTNGRTRAPNRGGKSAELEFGVWPAANGQDSCTVADCSLSKDLSPQCRKLGKSA